MTLMRPGYGRAMHLVTGRTSRRTTVGSDVLPQALADTSTGVQHAVTYGSPVGLCGTPVIPDPATAWPPAGAARCGTCEQLLATFVG